MRKVVACGLVYLVVAATSQGGQLHEAAKSGDLTAIAAALDAGADVEEQDKGATPLFLAVRDGHVEAAALLIERGARLDNPSRAGLPLTAAVLKSAPDLVRLLLEHGADPNAVARGEPMLHLAVSGNCLECVQALVQAGADVNAVWIRGDPARNPAIITPYHLARHDHHAEIAEYLLAHGVVIQKPQPISAKMSHGDPARGSEIFAARCSGCHVRRPQDTAGKGPNLWNVVGRDKASTKFGGYSEVLMAWEGSWTYEDLNTFLAGPTLTTPGVNMDVRGVPEENDRLNLIAYLRTLSDAPAPLP